MGLLRFCAVFNEGNKIYIILHFAGFVHYGNGSAETTVVWLPFKNPFLVVQKCCFMYRYIYK